MMMSNEWKQKLKWTMTPVIRWGHGGLVPGKKSYPGITLGLFVLILIILHVPTIKAIQQSCETAIPTMCTTGVIYIQDIIPSCYLCPGEQLSVTCNNTHGIVYLFEDDESIGNTNPFLWGISVLDSLQPSTVNVYNRSVTNNDDELILTCSCSNAPSERIQMGSNATFYVITGDIPEPVNAVRGEVSSDSFSDYLEVLITWEAPILHYKEKPLERQPTGYIVTIIGDNEITEYSIPGDITTQRLNLSNYTMDTLNVSLKTVCGDLTSPAVIVPSGDVNEPESSYAMSTSSVSSLTADYFSKSSSFLPFMPTSTYVRSSMQSLVSISPTSSNNQDKGNDDSHVTIIIGAVSAAGGIALIIIIGVIISGIIICKVVKSITTAVCHVGSLNGGTPAPSRPEPKLVVETFF